MLLQGRMMAMKLTKIKLINWHIFSNQTIIINGNTLITGENAEVAQALVSKLDEMIDKTYASNAAEDRIDEQLKYMRKIAKSKYNTYR